MESSERCVLYDFKVVFCNYKTRVFCINVQLRPVGLVDSVHLQCDTNSIKVIYCIVIKLL